ncbi:MAG: PRC-barrel domain-containing protein [Polyangia bacterium]
MTQIGFKELKGRMIMDKGGHEIGVLAGIDLNVDNWRVTDIEIKVNKGVLKAMGIKRPVFGTQAITVPISQISRTSDAILLEAELSKIQFSNKK